MVADTSLSRYLAMKERGAPLEDIYSAARIHGLNRTDAVSLLRELYRFSQVVAEAVAASVDGPLPDKLPIIGSHEQLLDILKNELGYCTCAPEESLWLLRDFLQAAQDRTDAVDDNVAFSRASRALGTCLQMDTAPGFAGWFVYSLDQRNLIRHGFRLTDSWITDKGRWLLEAIKRLSAPESGH